MDTYGKEKPLFTALQKLLLKYAFFLKASLVYRTALKVRLWLKGRRGQYSSERGEREKSYEAGVDLRKRNILSWDLNHMVLVAHFFCGFAE